MTRSFTLAAQAAAFAAGLAALGWTAAGYAGTHPLALAVTALVAGFYLLGAWELRCFQQATSALRTAVDGLAEPPPALGTWLGTLPTGLQQPVRLRIEGERVALPGPSLTPFLAGLLVLLGMLGTFLGMVVTLNGTGLALDNAGDLQALRQSLSAPVKGLGLAFGTSVAGIAASAALGLMSALARRDRLRAAQQLDVAIASHLRAFSRAHRRDQAFALMQRQAETLPLLVDRLQALMATMEQQSQGLSERLIANQEAFHGRADAAYGALAASVGQSLQASLAESARAASATLQPVVEATMAGIARETATLHAQLAGTTRQQLEGFSARAEASARASAEQWRSALDEHRRTSQALSQELRATLGDFGQGFTQRSAELVEQVAGRLDGAVAQVAATWQQALAQQAHSSEALAERQALASEALAERNARTHEALIDQQARSQQALAEQQAQAQQALAGQTQQALAATAASLAQQAEALTRSIDEAHARLQAEIGARDEQRLAAWTGALQASSAALQQQWQAAGEHTTRQQQQICQTLEQTARDMAAQAETHARQTIAEIGGLVQAAAEAPRVAAEVVAELRQKLSDSMARDNTMLEERSRILATLSTLLDAVNHASTEQRAAIDTLVSTSAGLLDRVGSRFTEQAEAETERMAAASAQLASSAVEVASLGEAFGLAVELFGQSNDKLVGQLQGVEAALAKSLARSDEQLAYYVAQAREVIDLSILSQQQIVEDLQRIAGRTLAPAEA
ncbi:MAG: DUF802 domain-containing protein [Pseudomonadota bacterium]